MRDSSNLWMIRHIQDEEPCPRSVDVRSQAMFMSRSARRKRYYVRPKCISSYFDAWLAENSTTLPMPIKKLSQRGSFSRYRLIGYPRAITLTASGYALSINVDWRVHRRKTFWDWLVSLDADYRRIGGGVICTCCNSDTENLQVVFPGLESLYANQLFEPLLKWLRDRLISSTHLCLGSTGDGSTWARLVRTDAVALEPNEILISLSTFHNQ